MELYAYAVNSEDGSPVPYASVQRLYPDGQNYGDALIADDKGYFNGRVPDGTYSWVISSAGYQTKPVALTNAVHLSTAIIKLDPNYAELPEVVVTPSSGKNNTMLYVGLGAAALYYAHHKKWI